MNHPGREPPRSGQPHTQDDALLAPDEHEKANAKQSPAFYGISLIPCG